MHWLDWMILTVPLVVCAVIALKTRRYARGVADFMAGGRNAGRFLICTARSEQGAGATTYVSLFQVFAVSGFTLSWWQQVSVPVGLIVAVSGFVVYRYRQTRALTLAQFFEMRYSRNFRLFTGTLAFFAGLVNFGIIPVIGARFMVYFLELPPSLHLFSHTIPTYLILMAIFLTICLIMTTSGGQITVLITDCAEGMLSLVFYLFITVMVLIMFFKWSETRSVLLDTAPGKSLVNPFDSFSLKDFNIWYVLMALSVYTYSTMAWQNSHAFNASAVSPHEAQMGGILGRWRALAVTVVVTLLAVCAMTYLHSAAGAIAVDAAIAHIPDASTASQMRVPIALSQLLPIGVKGALVSICLMGIIAGDGIHLHSWASILVQDVILPLRKVPLSTSQHLLLLRLAIVGVAIFAFCFGAIFPQTEYVQIWFAVTQAIFTAGAGAAIIGGLYWSRGTAAGAWAALLVGSFLTVAGIATRIYCQKVLGHEFVLNGAQISFFSSILAVLAYVGVSYVTCKKPHDMDRLLHRGRFAVEPEGPLAPDASKQRRGWLYRIVGIDEHFTRSDRWITIGIFSWSIFWFAVFVLGSAAYLIHPVSNAVWADYWLITAIFLPVLILIVTTIWFTIGCSHDMIVFFRRLREASVNPDDDGTVAHGENAVDLTAPHVQSSPLETESHQLAFANLSASHFSSPGTPRGATHGEP